MSEAAATLAWAATLGVIAGAAIPIGAALGRMRRILPRRIEADLRHSVLAFGAGVLVAAVGLVLAPEGAARLHPLATGLSFSAGALVFMAVDRALAKRRGSMAMFFAMLLDFLPEAVALGALLAGDPDTALLLAWLIFVQNLPEAFNAEQELAHRFPRLRRMPLFAAVALLGPVATTLGQIALAGQDALLGGLMLFAGGGILYLMFQDIAPKVPLRLHWGPPLGAVFGFLLALLGERLLSG